MKNKLCKLLILLTFIGPLTGCVNIVIPGSSSSSSLGSSSTSSNATSSSNKPSSSTSSSASTSSNKPSSSSSSRPSTSVNVTNQNKTLTLNSTNSPSTLSSSFSNTEGIVDGVYFEYNKSKEDEGHVYIGKTGFIRNADACPLGEITSFTINYSPVISSNPSVQNEYGFGYLKYRTSPFYVDNPNDYGVDIKEVNTDYTVSFTSDFPSYLSFYTPRDIIINSLTINFKDVAVNHQKENFKIQVLSTNDIHGQVKSTSSYPGLSSLNKMIKKVSSEKDQFNIVLDQGDLYQGTAEAGLSNGYNMDDFLIQSNYESTILGNHEFDWGAGRVSEHDEYLDISILANNIRYRSNDQSPSYCGPYKLVSRNGVKIGIIGAIGNVYSSISSSKVSDIYFLTGNNLTEQIKKDSQALKDMGAKFIILSLHDGSDSGSSSSISSYYNVNELSGTYVDLVLEGHTHQAYAVKDSKNVWHIQSGGNGSTLYASELVCTYNQTTDDYQVTMSTSSSAVTKYTKSNIVSAGSDEVMDEIDNWYSTYQYGKVQSEVVGYNVPYADDSVFEAKLAELYYLKGIELIGSTSSTSPVLGGGFIRTRTPYNLSGGTVKYGDVYNLLPFDNDIVLCSISGYYLSNRFINNTSSDYYVYGAATNMSINTNQTYYIITDSYTSDYSYNNLTVVRNLTEEKLVGYARDIYAEYLRKTYL